MPNNGTWGCSPSRTDGIKNAHTHQLRANPSDLRHPIAKRQQILPRKVSPRQYRRGFLWEDNPNGHNVGANKSGTHASENQPHFRDRQVLAENPTLLQLKQFLGNLHRVQCCALEQLVTANPETEAIVKCAIFPDSAHGTVVFVADK